jgi:thiosulfate/3-mercaptopyruvate sulfurtransferase
MHTSASCATILLLALATLCCGRAEGGDVEPVRPFYGEPEAPAQFANQDLLIDTERLSVLVGDGTTPPGASLVVIDARPNEQFAQEHLPGAFQLDSDGFQDGEDLPYGLAKREKIGDCARRFGITPETRIVVYDAHAGRLAARIWFTFWAYGHSRVCILEGGVDKWRDEGRRVSDTPAVAPSLPGNWNPSEKLRSICTLDEVKRFIVPRQAGRFPPTLILDARSNTEYAGSDVRADVGGHIPGSVNLPWDSMVRPVIAKRPNPEKKGFFVWREPAEIYALVRAAGLVPNQPVVVYDQSGGRSAHLLFTLYLMGFTQAVNYNAGWREYGNRRDVEVER